MFDVGGGEILLIVLAILLLFGPKKIPEIASMVGNGMRKVRKAQDEFTQHLRDLSTELEVAEQTANSPDGGAISQIPAGPVDAMLVPEPDVVIDEAMLPEPEQHEAPMVTIQPAQGSVAR